MLSLVFLSEQPGLQGLPVLKKPLLLTYSKNREIYRLSRGRSNTVIDRLVRLRRTFFSARRGIIDFLLFVE